MNETELLSPYTAKALEYVLAISYLLLFIPFWRFVQGEAIPEHVLGFGKWVSMAEDGPLWFRGCDQWTDEQGAPLVEKILAAYGAKRRGDNIQAGKFLSNH